MIKTLIETVKKNKNFYAFLFCFCILPLINSNAQTVGEILASHFKATGSEKLLDVQTITTRGTLKQGGFEIPIVTFNKRPNKVKIEGLFQDVKFIESFNGKTGWTYNPFRGNTEPVPLSAEYLEILKDRADIDGLLYNYTEKGYALSLLDPVNVGNTLTHVLLLTKPDKSIITYFIDSETNVVIKTISKMNIDGVESEFETFFSDYRFVDEILFPFSIDVMSVGQLLIEYDYSIIVLDKEIDDLIFEMPGTE